MTFSPEQRGIVVASVIAILLTAASLVSAYYYLPPGWVGAEDAVPLAERLGYALKWNLLMLLWLAGCVRAVSSGRFRSEADIRGSAYAPPSPAIAVQAAVLQNSLEQTVLAFGANLILASLLQGRELVVIPVLVALFLIGRVAFAWAYPKGAAARAFGMSLTGAALIAGLLGAIVLVMIGR
jgi:uncharacterized membrane protein YecN with MAPEG domain